MAFDHIAGFAVRENDAAKSGKKGGEPDTGGTDLHDKSHEAKSDIDGFFAKSIDSAWPADRKVTPASTAQII